MYLKADWVKGYSGIQEMKIDLHIPVMTKIPLDYEGWIDSKDDTLYVQQPNLPKNQDVQTLPSKNQIIVHCWNDPKARLRIAEMLGQSVMRI